MANDFLQDIKILQKQNKFHIALLKLEEIEKEDGFSHSDEFYHLKAQCYYQDLKLPASTRFQKAIDILDSKVDKTNQETLRLKGAIYKRKYQHSKDLRDLYGAISYYEQSAEDVSEDLGYGAANAVYLYYLLIQELKGTVPDSEISNYIEKINSIIIKSLKALEVKEKYSYLSSWHYASKSALYLSLEQFDKAKDALQTYKDKSSITIDRDQAITLKQTIELFDVLPNEHDEKELLNVLSMYGNAKSMINSVRKGKLGLALSGGGFRASLFHIGTLMRLAELDILRNVQVISTVSGGSIIGMYYYLEVKKLLEEKSNKTISKQDYIDLVARIKINFSKAIRENNIRMLAFQKRLKEDLTEKLGELYQEKLYKPIYGNSTPITNMSELKIKPKIGSENKLDFIPEFHNFELENKVPRIIVNATLLNNGHNWQFTAECMGENRYMVDESLEQNSIYEFEYYKKIEGLTKDDYLDKDISIAKAIASSSAVPVLFDPIELKGFDYEKEDVVRLSDGGLYDNLGLSSLLADECTHIIVSDGSKQLQTDKDPSIFRLDVSSRTTDVLMHRTRDGEYKMAKSLQDRGIIEKLDIIHLQEVNSGINDGLQEKIASIRTDLDSFHKLEAEAIMYAGYSISSQVLGSENNKEEIYFSKFINRLKDDEDNIFSILDISSKVLFKLNFQDIPKWIYLLCLFILGLLGYFLPVFTFVLLLVSCALFNTSKESLKQTINNVFGFVMRCISKFYMKYLNSKYIAKGGIE